MWSPSPKISFKKQPTKTKKIIIFWYDYLLIALVPLINTKMVYTRLGCKMGGIFTTKKMFLLLTEHLVFIFNYFVFIWLSVESFVNPYNNNNNKPRFRLPTQSRLANVRTLLFCPLLKAAHSVLPTVGVLDRWN